MSIKTMIYSILILAALYGLFTIGFPFLLAYLLALLLEPLIQITIKGLKIRRTFAVLLVCTLFVLLVIGLGFLLIINVIYEAAALSSSVSAYTSTIYPSIDNFMTKYINLFQALPLDTQNYIGQISKSLLDSLRSTLGVLAALFFNLARQVPDIFLQILIIFISLYLISLQLPNMKRYFFRFFDDNVHPNLEIVLDKLHAALLGFIRAQLFISVLIFIVVYIGFLILGINYPAAMALLITCVDILPVFGTGSVIIPMSVYYTFTGNYFLGIGLLVHYAVIVAFRRIIEPKVLSSTIGIGALTTLASMYVGIKLTGFIGLFLGPATAILFKSLIEVGIMKIKIKL